MRIKNYSLFLDASVQQYDVKGFMNKRPGVNGLLKFPDVYVDSFISILEDEHIKHEVHRHITSAKYTEELILLNLYNHIPTNNIDYKYVYKVLIAGKTDEEFLEIGSIVEELKLNLEDDWDFIIHDYGVREGFGGSKRLLMISKEIIPVSEMNLQARNEIINFLKSINIAFIELEMEQFPTLKAYINSTDAKIISEWLKTEFSKKWMFNASFYKFGGVLQPEEKYLKEAKRLNLDCILNVDINVYLDKEESNEN